LIAGDPAGREYGYNIAITTATFDRAPAASVSKPRYLLGAAADAFLLGPGATLLVTGIVLALGGLGAGGAVASLALALNLVFVGPHYAATWERAYTSREVIRAHPIVTLVVPLALAAAAFAAVH
jgi:hypothetical protein